LFFVYFQRTETVMSRNRGYGNGYEYVYDGSQMYYQDPNYQQGYYGNDANWGWNGYQNYGQGQQYYGNYEQPNVGYDYGYGYGNGTDYDYTGPNSVPQDYQQLQNRSQDNSGRKSKYSYSQNRSRNRQRPDVKSDGTAGADETLNTGAAGDSNRTVETSETSDNTNNNASSSDNKQTDQSTMPESSLNVGAEVFYTSYDNQIFPKAKPPDRNRNRGGRFQGTDSRTKHFDRDQQEYDRRRGYNRSYIPNKAENNSSINDKEVADGSKMDVSSGDSMSYKGARPKSFNESNGGIQGRDAKYKNNKQPERPSYSNRGNDNRKGGQGTSYQNKFQKQKQELGQTKNEENETDAVDRVDDEALQFGKDLSRDANGKKKKKEFQVNETYIILCCL